MRRWLTLIATCFSLSIGPVIPLSRAGETKQEAASVDKAVAIDGVLDEKDTADKRTGGPSKTYLFRLLKGKGYVIDLISKDFDSFLRVLDADGKELAWDDDSGGGLNSKLKFDPVQDGDYRIVATSLDRKPGKFQLKIEVAKPFVEEIPPAKDVGKDGLKIEGKLVKGEAIDDGKRTKGCPRKVQPVRMSAGKKYTIDLVSDDFDAFLRLLDPAGKEVAFDDDSGGDLHARIVYECKEDGVFRIIMTSLDRATGRFNLKVRAE